MSPIPPSLGARRGLPITAAGGATPERSPLLKGRLLLRRGLNRLARAALRLRSRPLSPDRESTVLVLSPHPDDETFGCGGFVALAARERASVHVAFVTDGGASHPAHPAVSATEIAARRAAEARAATGILGVNPDNLTFLGVRDGTLAHLDRVQAEATIGMIAGLLLRVRPGVILLPCRNDGSSEHNAAFRLACRAVDQAGLRPRVLEFPVWSWWSPFLLMGHLFNRRRIWRTDLRGLRELKGRAIGAYASQTLPIAPETVAALPAGFASMFDCGEEFLFEE